MIIYEFFKYEKDDFIVKENVIFGLFKWMWFILDVYNVFYYK